MKRTKKLALLALLTAVALIMFVIELQIPAPIPVPGVKLGLSNIISLIVLLLFGWKEALAVLLVRIVLGSVLTGQLGALPYALLGGLLSFLAMCLLKRIVTKKQLWVLSVVGGFFHNLGQLGMAVLITKTPGLVAYLPILLLSGMIAGLFTGLAAQAVISRLRKR